MSFYRSREVVSTAGTAANNLWRAVVKLVLRNMGTPPTVDELMEETGKSRGSVSKAMRHIKDAELVTDLGGAKARKLVPKGTWVFIPPNVANYANPDELRMYEAIMSDEGDMLSELSAAYKQAHFWHLSAEHMADPGAFIGYLKTRTAHYNPVYVAVVTENPKVAAAGYLSGFAVFKSSDVWDRLQQKRKEKHETVS